ncbi:HAD family hydrolase [Ruania alba]|uniref:FMN phosphatase YigB, HAD superfamily n=1 Tax=Ruania alba TaxID=648782 RepID=A0A1H5DCA6_9MICO|nr:HAD family hydrolase [Ruania alba]SED76543.1 FMN phosphatase YigB, HAD superfamily [Ruania alba]
MATTEPPEPAQPSAVLVLDFDGTLCIGDDPVLFYAEEAERRHPGAALVQPTRTFLAGSGAVPDAPDGYHAVAAMARAAGLSNATLSEAYLASRARLDAGEGETRPPDGVRHLLTDVRSAGVRVVLVTNAPLVGAQSWLDTHELTALIDEVVPNAGKPAAMPQILDDLAARWGLAAPQRLASVGDVWVNDIGPAMERGSAGFFIDRFGLGHGPSTSAAATFEGVVAAIRDWVRTVTAP